MPTWHHDKFADLAKQLTYSPAEKRAEQLANAAALVPDIDPAKGYPWEFILYRITGYRPTKPVDAVLDGAHLRADLSQLVEFLSGTLNFSVSSAPEPVLLLEQVLAQFNVSAKTIQRWRRQGLLAQRYVFPDGRRRLGFLPSAVRGFASKNAARVQRSALFRHVTPRERELILRYARRKARRQVALMDIADRLAHRLHRSPETIRYTIRRHDRAHPEAAIFPDAAPPIRPADRRGILEAFTQGTSVQSIARRYGRKRSSIYRAVYQQRAEALKNLPIEFVPNPLFDLADADNILLTVLPREALARAAAHPADEADPLVARVPQNLPPHLQALFRLPALPAELETDAFRRMNYLKAKVYHLQQALDPATATSAPLADIEALLAQATTLKNQLVQANLRVAVHVARKHLAMASLRGLHGADLAELVSDASVWLLRAVERFDFARGVKFATYASYAIAKNFARGRDDQLAAPDARLVTGQHERLAELGARDAAPLADQIDASLATADLARVLETLPPRERELLMSHYGLHPSGEQLSLAQLGQKLGLTKTRVQQLETRALRKLRRLLAAPSASRA